LPSANLAPFPTRRSSDLRTLQLDVLRRQTTTPDGTHRVDHPTRRQIARLRDHNIAHSHRPKARPLLVQLGHDRWPTLAVDRTVQDRKSTRLNSSHVKISY